MTFEEDRSRIHIGPLPRIMASLRNTALSQPCLVRSSVCVVLWAEDHAASLRSSWHLLEGAR